MNTINLAVGYADVSNFTHLNQTMVADLPTADFQTPAPFQGLPSFREAIAAKLKIANQMDDITPAHILVTAGATQGLFEIVQVLLQEGDEVLLPLPAWGYFTDLLTQRKTAIKTVATTFDHQYKLTPEALENNLSDSTKMLIFTNPGNPGGGVYSPTELAALVAILEQYPDLLILADEMYELLNWTDYSFTALASFPSIAERVITVNGFSKSFSLTSWRVAYIAATPKIIQQLLPYHQLMTYGLPVASQLVAWQAIQKEELYRTIWQQVLTENREKLVQLFENQPLIDIYSPEGAYFIFPDFSKFAIAKGMKQSSDLGVFFREKAGLIFADGATFGQPFSCRINFAQSRETIRKVLSRLEDVLS